MHRTRVFTMPMHYVLTTKGGEGGDGDGGCRQQPCCGPQWADGYRSVGREGVGLKERERGREGLGFQGGGVDAKEIRGEGKIKRRGGEKG